MSRTHVLRLRRDAEAAELISRVAENEVVLLPKVRGDLQQFYAAMVWGYPSFARRALLTQIAFPHRHQVGAELA